MLIPVLLKTYRGGFCEKLLEASPMSDRANASRLQVRPAAGPEPISGGGSVSGITDLRKGKKLLRNSNCSQREQSEKM